MKTIKSTKKKTKKYLQEITNPKQAKEESRKIAKDWKKTFDAISDFIFILDKDFRFVEVNKAICDFLKKKPEDLIGKRCYEVVHGTDKPWPNCPYKKILEAKKAITEEINDPNLGVPLLITASPIFDDNGTIIGCVHVAKNIAERKKIEQVLKESEEKFRKIFESASDALICLDISGRIIDVNRKAVEVFGGSKKEVLGRHFTKVSIFSTREISKLMKNFVEILTSKKPHLTVRIKNKKGQEIFLECSTSLLKKDHKDVNVLVVARDITERKGAERELLEEKIKLQTYLDAAGIIILILSPENKVLFLNKNGSEVLGYKGMEILGKDWLTNFIPEKNRVEVRDIFEKLINQRKGLDEYFESPVLTKGGEEKSVTWHNALLRDEKGRLQAILVTGADITELQEARLTIEQLRELDKMKDDFLNIAAHELRTPLTSIIGLTEIMKRQKFSLTPPLPKYTEIIYNEGVRLAHIIKRMLTVTRFESGRETIQIESFNLPTLISPLLLNLNILAKKKKARIVTKTEKKNIVIRSDKEKISQVIYNFIDNAVKYGPEGQTIIIAVTKPDKDRVKIEVRDHGPGIPKDLQQKLFTKFSQLEPSLTRAQEGTGLGLYICKLIIDMLGGKIGVESKLGKGSTFYFILPIHPYSSKDI